MSHRYCIRGAAAALALTLGVSGASGLAAQTGAVTGVVTDATTGQPLDGARVGIAGTRTSGLTDSDGRYLLGGVPAGAQTVKVVIIGYGTREREVTVATGSTLVADFSLRVSAVALDQLVGAGADPTERRGIGTSLPTLDLDRIDEDFPVAGFVQALEGRIPGVRANGTNGGIGSGRELRIRGADSIEHTRQRPLVLIDGVRVDTEKLEWGAMLGVTCCYFSGGAGEDRLSDLSPEEIDRVEVLKGPAAAALFGVEGSGGVIHVFTKRGRTDTPPVFTVTSGFGLNRLRANLPTRLRPDFSGPDGFAAWDPNQRLIENGLVNNYDLTVSGGGREMTYFAAGGLTYEEGSVKPSDQTRANLKGQPELDGVREALRRCGLRLCPQQDQAASERQQLVGRLHQRDAERPVPGHRGRAVWWRAESGSDRGRRPGGRDDLGGGPLDRQGSGQLQPDAEPHQPADDRNRSGVGP